LFSEAPKAGKPEETRHGAPLREAQGGSGTSFSTTASQLFDRRQVDVGTLPNGFSIVKIQVNRYVF